MAEVEIGPCLVTNCLVAVPQDRHYVVEVFGQFRRILRPGLACTGVDLCGCCIGLRSISSRVQQQNITVQTKTRDNVFVTCRVAVQFMVIGSSVEDAIYKLDNLDAQIEAYVADVVRSQVPAMSLDEAFEKKDDISETVRTALAEQMEDFGFQILKALVTEVVPDPAVMAAMNEINKQKRLREAAAMAAEAEKIRIVKAAEAAADASQLQGEGIARQRKAIVDGLRESITSGTKESLSTEKISELLLVTQYFETLRDIAATTKSQTVFLPHGPSAVGDVASQIRDGLLQASAPSQMKMK